MDHCVEGEVCPICLEELTGGVTVLRHARDSETIRTRCGHFYHARCIQKVFWREGGYTKFICPLCRRQWRLRLDTRKRWDKTSARDCCSMFAYLWGMLEQSAAG